MGAIDMLNIRIERTTAPKAKPAPGEKLGFGVDYDAETRTMVVTSK